MKALPHNIYYIFLNNDQILGKTEIGCRVLRDEPTTKCAKLKPSITMQLIPNLFIFQLYFKQQKLILKIYF